MSLVVAIKDKDRVYFGADSLASIGTKRFVYTKNESNYKVIKLTKDLLFANVGLACVKQVWVENKKLFNKLPEEGLTKEFLVNEIVPKIKQGLIDSGIVKNDGENENAFLLAWKDRLFLIDKEYSVFVIDKEYAMGAGSKCANMILQGNTLSIRDKMLKALDVAEYHEASVGGPKVFIDTKNMKYEVVED